MRPCCFLFPLLVACSCGAPASRAELAPGAFDSRADLLSLHYDHAPDRDDGQSAAADRTLLQSLFGIDWVREHVIPVSGATGKNAAEFNPDSDAVMDAAWNDCGWLAAHEAREDVVAKLAARWLSVIDAGGDVFVKEGGQSDLTADVVRTLRGERPDLDTTSRIHVVQHSDWNEEQTGGAALAYTREHTDYIRIKDANRYLNIKGGDPEFVRAATSHPVFGSVWRAAFAYYDPQVRLDFSDTGELFRILGLGELSVSEFRERFLGIEAR